MKFLLRFHRHLLWINLPVAALIALLQRTPLLRVVSAAESLAHASPVGHVLRSAFTTVASLGAVHALAGATQWVVSRTSVSGTVGAAVPVVAFSVSGSPASPGSYRVTDLPPGVTITGVAANGIFNGSAGTLSGTPTASGTFLAAITAYQNAGARGDAYGPITVAFVIAPATPVTAVFSLQPASRTIAVGGNVTFTASASGTPSPTFQWRKDGVAIPAAVGVSYTLTNVQLGQAGAYSVAATNSAGTTVSESAILTVNSTAVGSPAFTTLPSASVTVGIGSTVVFNSTATGATSYRWQRNNATLLNATSANLVVLNASTLDAGTYRVIATNSAGSTTSRDATLIVNPVATTDLGRLVNLSILTTAGPGAKVLTVGAVVGPLNFSGSLPLLIRAVGPTLGLPPPAGFGIGGVLVDPVLTINASGVAAPIANNDNWGGGAPLNAAFAAVGAFALPANSLDSSALSDAAPGGYTVQVTGKADTSGLVIAEIYDRSTGRTATSPRLINLSSLTQIDAGANLAVGFVLRGSTARTVLVRGIGPSLGTIFGLGGVMSDPKLELFDQETGSKITENDNWGGDAQLMDAAASVGAFALADTATKDAVLLVTLAPGAYSARVSGIGSSAGTAIVEVYELP
ncbi:MAG: hypothetical protein RLZZ162_3337 [Verrucomicrobiota bacterium]